MPHAPALPAPAPPVLQDILLPAILPALKTSASSPTARFATHQPLVLLARTSLLLAEGLARQPVQQASPTARSATAQPAAPSVLWAIKYQETAHNASTCALSATVPSASQRPLVLPARPDIR